MKKTLPILTFAIILTLTLISASCPTVGDPPLYDPQALFALPGFGIGINIGNTLDSIGTNTWLAGETGWGNPRITREFIRSLKRHGFKTIRLPVTWAENIGAAPDYTINIQWMNRVEQIVNWILEEDMYCILNLHHDGGHSDKSWILNMSTNEVETLDKFNKVWRQIAVRFRNAPDKLILESMNEVGFDDIWNRWSGDSADKAEAYRKFNALNQAFVDTVRATGGDNANRTLLIAGYWTDIDATCDPLFQMPSDTAQNQNITPTKLLLSVHYYTPPQFCIAEEPDTSWGFRADWGTDADIDELRAQFDKLKTNFIDRGIPIILGEYGVTKKNKVAEARIRWMVAVTQISLDYGICPVLWDTGLESGGGEVQRQEPYDMSDVLRWVLAGLKIGIGD